MKKFLSITICIGMLLGSASTYADSYIMHTIQSGDTYLKISQTYNKDLHELQEINEDLGSTLYAGNLMKIESLPQEKSISIQVDGKKISTPQPPYLENSRTFIPIRSIGEALNIEEINWNDATQAAILKHDHQTIRLPIGSNTAIINDEKITLDAPVNIYKGRTFVPLRFVAEAFNFDVHWDDTKYIIDMRTKDHTSEDVYWLSRLVEAEAKGEPFEGKLAVANVIINRKNNAEFPHTIKDVIFDESYGFQFTPVMNNTIYNDPSNESIKAAKEALRGHNNIGDCLYFLNPRTSKNFWIVNNRTIYRSINLHDFYL